MDRRTGFRILDRLKVHKVGQQRPLYIGFNSEFIEYR